MNKLLLIDYQYFALINLPPTIVCGGLTKATNLCKNADLCLALGTSLTVYPASDLPKEAKYLILINLQETDQDQKATIRVWATCDAFFMKLMPILEKNINSNRDNNHINRFSDNSSDNISITLGNDSKRRKIAL